MILQHFISTYMGDYDIEILLRNYKDEKEIRGFCNADLGLGILRNPHETTLFVKGNFSEKNSILLQKEVTRGCLDFDKKILTIAIG